MSQQLVAAVLLSGDCALAIVVPCIARWRYRLTRHLPYAKRVWIMFTIGGEFLAGAALIMGIILASLAYPSLPRLEPGGVDILTWFSAGCGTAGIIAEMALIWQLISKGIVYRRRSDPS